MRLKYTMVFWLALVLLGLTNPARAYICDNAQFFEQCPTADPAFSKFITDFKIRKNGVLINPATLTCNAPVSAIPIAQWTDELVLLQSLRAIYYMDLGRSGHLPWTPGTLYDWLKAAPSPCRRSCAMSETSSAMPSHFFWNVRVKSFLERI